MSAYTSTKRLFNKLASNKKKRYTTRNQGQVREVFKPLHSHETRRPGTHLPGLQVREPGILPDRDTRQREPHHGLRGNHEGPGQQGPSPRPRIVPVRRQEERMFRDIHAQPPVRLRRAERRRPGHHQDSLCGRKNPANQRPRPFHHRKGRIHVHLQAKPGMVRRYNIIMITP